MLVFKVANQRETHEEKFLRIDSERELSEMVSALTRVVSGEASDEMVYQSGSSSAPHIISSGSGSTSSDLYWTGVGQKRQREEEEDSRIGHLYLQGGSSSSVPRGLS